MHTERDGTIRWGILGCGDVTEVKSGPGFQLATHSALTAVMRRDAVKAADYAQRHGVPHWHADAQALIQDDTVDAIYIATPPGAHATLALAVAAAGKPCYIEKPMARHAPECEAMNRAFETRGLPLFVAYYRRALPRFLKARDLIASDRLGELRDCAYQRLTPPAPLTPGAPLPWRLLAEHAGGGLFLDVGSHALDILDFLLGPLTLVAASAQRRPDAPYTVEDAVDLTFTAHNGAVTGRGIWNFAADRRADEITLTGTRGTLRLSVFGDEPLRLETAAGIETFSLPNPRHIQQPMIQSIVDQLRGAGPVCPSTGRSAARTSALMDHALADFYGGRTDAFWSRAAR